MSYIDYMFRGDSAYEPQTRIFEACPDFYLHDLFWGEFLFFLFESFQRSYLIFSSFYFYFHPPSFYSVTFFLLACMYLPKFVQWKFPRYYNGLDG